MSRTALVLFALLTACSAADEATPQNAPDTPSAAAAPGCPSLSSISQECANQLYRDLAARIGEAETNLTPLPADAGAYPQTAGFYPEPIGTPDTLTAHLEPIATPGLIAAWMASGTTTIEGRVAVDVEGCGGPVFRVVAHDGGWVVVADVEDARPEEGVPIRFRKGADARWRIDGKTLPVGVACGTALPAAPPLKVAIYGSYMPLHGVEDASTPLDGAAAADGARAPEPVGFEVDIARLLADTLGREPLFINTREAFGSGSLDAVHSGKVDIGMNSITATDARRERVDFTTPYLELQYGVAGLAPWPATNQPSATRFVTASGLAAAALQDELAGAQIETVGSSRTAVQMVLAGDADWLVEEEVGLRLLTEDTDLLVGDWAFGSSPLAIATPKGQVAAIEEALLLVKASPAYQEALVRWQLDDPAAATRATSASTDKATVNGQIRSALQGLGSMSWASLRRAKPDDYEDHGCDRGLVWFQFLDDSDRASKTGGYTKNGSAYSSIPWVPPSAEWARYITADGLSGEQLGRGAWHVLYAPEGKSIQVMRVEGVDVQAMSDGLTVQAADVASLEPTTLTFRWLDRNRHIGSWMADSTSRPTPFRAEAHDRVLNRGGCDDDTKYVDEW